MSEPSELPEPRLPVPSPDSSDADWLRLVVPLSLVVVPLRVLVRGVTESDRVCGSVRVGGGVPRAGWSETSPPSRYPTMPVVMASACLSYPSGLSSCAASPGFAPLPISTNTSGTVVSAGPAMSLRVCRPSTAPA